MSGRLLYPEARAALARAARMNRLTRAQLTAAVSELDAIIDQIDHIEVTTSIARTAGALAQHHALRGYDAVHLTSPRRTIIALLLTLSLGATACSSDNGDLSTAADGATATTTAGASGSTSPSSDAVSTVAGVGAAQWSDNVTITVNEDSFRYESNGIPSHELPDQFLIPNDGNMPPFTGDDIAGEFHIADTDGLIVESPVDVEITLNPVYSEEVTPTSLSTIGVLISGVPLFNDYEDQTREFIALDDNLSLDGVYFIDACNGHPLASGASYPYHGIPYCVTDNVDVAGQHSTILGVLLDGFPVYGDKDVDGSSLTSDDLDECSGHVGSTPEFPDGIYHYHLTEDRSPYSIDCYHGEIDNTQTTNAGPGDGGPPDGGPPDGAQSAPNGGPPAGFIPEEQA